MHYSQLAAVIDLSLHYVIVHCVSDQIAGDFCAGMHLTAVTPPLMYPI